MTTTKLTTTITEAEARVRDTFDMSGWMDEVTVGAAMSLKQRFNEVITEDAAEYVQMVTSQIRADLEAITGAKSQLIKRGIMDDLDDVDEDMAEALSLAITARQRKIEVQMMILDEVAKAIGAQDRL